MLQYYVMDDTRRDRLSIVHFSQLRDAVRAYKDLPDDARKVLGVMDGSRAVELILRLPLRPGEPPVEDVLDLGFLEDGGWKAKPGFMPAVHELAVCLMVRYCLFRGCLIPAPKKKALSRGLREKYLWPDVPGDFNTAIHWIDVAGVGRLSVAEFKRRYRQDDAAPFYPLVLRIGACGMTRHGRYAALDVTPWQFHLLARRSRERLDQNKNRKEGNPT